MPVVVVTAPRLPDAAAEHAALASVAAAVAAALDLPRDGVHVITVHAASAVLGPLAVAPWPVVVIHGGARAAADAAAAAAGEAVAASWHRPVREVWVQWAVRA